MATVSVNPRFTPEQYLALERPAETRSEYRDGAMIPMDVSKHRQALIVGNCLGLIGNQLVDRPGEVFAVAMRLHVPSARLYTYPDILALCHEPILEDAEQDTLLNPAMIAEVLSPSTEDYDRGEKFDAYRQIESLQDYVLISQDQVRVELFAKRGEEWVRTELNRLDDVLRLDSINCDVPLSGIYAKTPMVGSDQGID